TRRVPRRQQRKLYRRRNRPHLSHKTSLSQTDGAAHANDTSTIVILWAYRLVKLLCSAGAAVDGTDDNDPLLGAVLYFGSLDWVNALLARVEHLCGRCRIGGLAAILA